MTQLIVDRWPPNLGDSGPEVKRQVGAGSHLPGQVCAMSEVWVPGRLLMLSVLASLS